jgi:hypothetical protein
VSAVTTTARAQELAQSLLDRALPRRWAHTQGVGRQAASLAPILGDEAELLAASGWLHDIGYSPPLAKTGFHPLDGARYLRDVEHADDRICRLVAHHTCAVIEAEERGLLAELSAEFAPVEDGDLTDALIYSDMTTDPDGKVTTARDRLAEILKRYGPEDVVTRSITRATPELIAAVRRVEERLLGANASPGAVER